MRQALHDCITGLGYRAAVASHGNVNTSVECSLVIIDLNQYPVAGRADCPQSMAELPALYVDSPLPKTEQQQRLWAKQIAAKVACMHADHQLGVARPGAVWLMLASAGGPEAIRAFIDALPAGCPVGFLYGQHIDSGFESNLVKMLNGRTGFSAGLAKTGQRLSPGHISVVPSQKRVCLLQDDTLLVEPAAWPGRYRPSLDDLVVEFGHRPKALGGVIVFSGMGDDGASACRLYAASGGSVWAQEPSSCVVSAMPDAVLATGCVTLCATPLQLAQKLVQHLED